MKTAALILAGAVTAQVAAADSFTFDFDGSFDSGTLTGWEIFGFIEIDNPNGLAFGTADTNPATFGDAELFALDFELTNGIDSIFFTEFDDYEALATFQGTFVTGIDFVGTNFEGDLLNVYYDAFAADVPSGIFVEYESFSGAVSTGTLDLPVAVPEPSTVGLLAGMAALGVAGYYRRRKQA